MPKHDISTTSNDGLLVLIEFASEPTTLALCRSRCDVK